MNFHSLAAFAIIIALATRSVMGSVIRTPGGAVEKEKLKRSLQTLEKQWMDSEAKLEKRIESRELGLKKNEKDKMVRTKKVLPVVAVAGATALATVGVMAILGAAWLALRGLFG